MTYFRAKIKPILGKGFSYLIIGLILFYILFPLYWMLLSSFRSPNTVFSVNYLPTNLTPLNYRILSLWEEFFRALENSIMVASAVVALTLLLGMTAAYALGRLNFKGRALSRHIILFMTAFPQIAVVGGLYLLIANPCVVIAAECRSLSLYNSLPSLIITYLILTLPLTIWFLAVYYKSLPGELEEAAYVDGATPFQAFWYVLLPLSLPGLVTTGLLSFIIAWNEFMFALTFTLDESSRTAPVAISLVGGWGSLTDLAAAVMVTIPVVGLAVVLRRQLTAGLTGLVSLRPREDIWLISQLSRVGLPSIRLTVSTQILLVVLALLLVSFGYTAYQALTYPYPLDYGEGPLLDQVARLAQFQNIYRADISEPPYTISNYPPLFLLVQMPFMWLFGPAFWYGRLLSIFSALLAAICVGLIVYHLSRDPLAAVIGGLTLLAVPYITGWSVLNRIDSLALGLSLLGIWLVVRWPEKRWSVVASALLLTAAIYTRQSYGLAAPLAAFVWLLSRRRWRPALLLTLLVGGVSLGLFGALNWLTGGGFFFNVVTANVNAYDPDRAAWFLEKMWTYMPYLITMTALFVAGAGWFGVKSWWLIAPYAVGAALSGLTVGKVGSNINYFLEFSAAMSLAVGGLLAWQGTRPWLRQGLLLLLALQMYLLLPGIPELLYLQSRFEQPKEAARLMEIVHGSTGPVLADDAMGLIPLDGRRLYIQPFEVTQLAKAGLWDQTPFIQAIERQAFETIVILQVTTPFGPLPEINWSPEMIAAIRRHYRVVDRIGEVTMVYQPRERSLSQTPE